MQNTRNQLVTIRHGPLINPIEEIGATNIPLKALASEIHVDIKLLTRPRLGHGIIVICTDQDEVAEVVQDRANG